MDQNQNYMKQQPEENQAAEEKQQQAAANAQRSYTQPYYSQPYYYVQQPPQWQGYGYPQYMAQGYPVQSYPVQNAAYSNGQGAGFSSPETQPHKKRRGWTVVAIIAGVLASMMIGCLLSMSFLIPTLRERLEEGSPYTWEEWGTEQDEPIIKKDDYAPNPEITSIGGEAPVIANEANPVPEIAEQISESVVGVNAYVEEDGEFMLYSRGTGFVIHESGYILTNYHVVVEGSNYTISVEGNEQELEAKYVGGDATMDLAVLKVDHISMKAVALGSSAETKVGEMAIAMGNPAGADANLTGSVTVGYVSYVGRKLSYNGTLQEFLQIDAAVNPGNSGGPLVNSKGEVIGIVTLKSLISSYDEYGNPINSEGLGFAIPVDAAKEIALRIINGGSIQRPGIGILYVELSAEEAAQQQLPQGKMIQEFMSGSPAEKAGLELGDVIIKCNGVSLIEQDILVETIQAAEPGETIELTVWREGKELDFSVVVGDMNHMVVY